MEELLVLQVTVVSLDGHVVIVAEAPIQGGSESRHLGERSVITLAVDSRSARKWPLHATGQCCDDNTNVL